MLDRHAEIELSYPFAGEKPEKIRLKAQVNQFPLTALFGDVRSEHTSHGTAPPRDETAFVTARLDYEGPRESPLSGKGELRVEHFVLPEDRIPLSHEEPLVANIADGRLNFSQVRIYSKGRQIDLSGYVDQKAGWHGKIRGSLGLSRYFSHLEFIEQLKGRLVLDIGITGPLLQPELDGVMRIEDGQLSFPLAGSVIGTEEVSAEISLSKGNAALTSLTGKVGDGTLTGSGQVTDVFNPELRTTTLSFSLDNISIEPVDKLTLLADGQLEYRQKGNSAGTFGGQVMLLKGLYEDNVDVAVLLRAFSQMFLVSPPITPTSVANSIAEKEPMQLAINVKADNGLLVETNILEAELREDITVAGTPETPRITGRASALDGVFWFRGNQFTLIHGDIVFPSDVLQLDPRLDILGETSIRTATGSDRQVRVAITGTLSNPSVKFSGEGGLTESEIISLLSEGNSFGSLQLLGALRTDRTFRDLISPGSDLSIQDRLSGLTGFSEVKIENGLSERTGEFVPRVVASRPLAYDVGLTIQSELASGEASEFNLTYPLTPYLSLISGWRSTPVTQNVDNGSGSYKMGLRYRTQFSGLLLLAPRYLKEEGM